MCRSNTDTVQDQEKWEHGNNGNNLLQNAWIDFNMRSKTNHEANREQAVTD